MKRNCILLVTIGLILIIGGSLFGYLSRSKKESNNYQSKVNSVLSSYDKFQEKLEIATGERTVIMSYVINHYFDEEVEEKYHSWTAMLDDYTKTIDDVYTYKDIILNNCVKESYKESDITSKCESMIIGYETMINYYVRDLNGFNQFISTYNSNYPDLVKNIYELKYNYMDINDDGKYLGK